MAGVFKKFKERLSAHDKESPEMTGDARTAQQIHPDTPGEERTGHSRKTFMRKKVVDSTGLQSTGSM
uniref:Uncharacterized protein n=1 Tax=Panagrolaimus sp. JU765 TaxID=591449 RepID=A0AC34QEU5_9BILA